MTQRERNFGKAPYTPSTPIDGLFPGTFYLTHIDEKFRRFYSIKDPLPNDLAKDKSFNWSGDL
jgi:hypothetical protein